jgi:hypothetical protein
VVESPYTNYTSGSKYLDTNQSRSGGRPKSANSYSGVKYRGANNNGYSQFGTI